MPANYFEIFGFDVNFRLNEPKLEASYLNLIKKYHPDKFSDPEHKKIAYQNTITINEAYKRIKDEVKRAEYILSLHDIIVGTENDNVKPDQDFLIHLIEIEEELEVATSKNDFELILKQQKNNYSNYISSFEKFLDQKNFVEAASNAIKMRYTKKLISKIGEKLTT